MIFFSPDTIEHINDDKKVSTEYALNWWYRAILQKSHREDLEFQRVINEIDYAPPTKFNEGGKMFQKGQNNWNTIIEKK